MNLHGQVLAAAERAADSGEMDADLLLSQPQARRDLVAVDVQPLRRDIDVHAALTVRNSEPRFGPQERLILDPELVVALDGDIAGHLGVAAEDPHIADDVRPGVVAKAVTHRPVLRMDGRLVRRALHVHDRLERLVLDDDLGRRPPRLLRVLGGDERDRLADVARPVEGEHRLVGELEPVPLVPGNVLVRHHGVNARHG